MRALQAQVKPNFSLRQELPFSSNSPSGTLQIRVFSSFTVSFGLPMISRKVMQRFLRAAPSAQDHKVIRIIN
jgi:hypothetical protein